MQLTQFNLQEEWVTKVGDRKYVPALSKAAVAVGVAGVFMETHNDPDNAPSDGPNMVKLDDMNDLIKKLIEIDNLVKEK